MAIGRSINDSGTWRALVRRYVNDSGSWLDIINRWVNDSGTWRKTFGITATYSMLTGSDGGIPSTQGYRQSLYGTLTPAPTGNLGQYSIIEITDGIASAGFKISGFSSDPGQDFFTSITCNGNTLTAAGVFSYSYSSGTASWLWSGSSFGGISNGVTYPITVIG